MEKLLDAVDSISMTLRLQIMWIYKKKKKDSFCSINYITEDIILTFDYNSGYEWGGGVFADMVPRDMSGIIWEYMRHI
jgi:hypothetical protein